MSIPTVIWGGPASMAYELTTGAATNEQKGRYPLGTQLVLQDGRKFRYTLNGGTLAVLGNVYQTAAIISTDEDLTCADGAIGDRSITFTHTATPAANYFSEGTAVISVTPGGGDTYKILSHLVIVATTGQVVNLAAGHALRRTLTTVSRLDLTPNPYAYVIKVPVTTITGTPVGVAVSALAATTGMGWLQTAGVCGVLQDDTAVAGTHTVVPSAAAGAAGPETAVIGNMKIEVPIGTILKVAADTKFSTVLLRLDS